MNNQAPNHPLVDIIMPALGADMRDGTLIEWLIRPGQQVEKGDTIAVIETSKGAIEMETYHSGTISELLVMPEIKLPVGSVMARMECDTPAAETAAAPPLPSADPLSQPTESAASFPPKILNDSPLSDDFTGSPAHRAHEPSLRLRVSPVARKVAHQLALDLSLINGSGPQGAIVLRDLPPAATRSNSAAGATKTASASSSNTSPMRQAISEAMTRSKREIPHYYLALEINLTKAQHWLSAQNERREPEQRLLLPALVLCAIARQLPRFPELNGFFQDGQFVPSQEVNLANTISLRDGGLVIPAILNADQLSIEQIMEALRDLTERSRRGRLRSSEISQGTITVTSIGERGADSITGVIYPPQVAIIGLGRSRRAPVVKDESLEIADVMTVTLAADHRVSDGITGARFLNALAKQLQDPESL